MPTQFSHPTAPIQQSLRRMKGIARRHFYLLRSSWGRMVELMYWPIIQMILWGMISRFFAEQSSGLAYAAASLIGSVLLWDVLLRGQLGLSLMFFEEMWSRNLGHLFTSPLRAWEWAIAMMVVSFLRVLFSFICASVLAFLLYQFQILEMGFELILFFFNLIIMGWSIGLMVCAIVLVHGLGAEGLAWVAMFTLAPLCAVYYPVSTLPAVMQPIAAILPATHVFEGMRAILQQKVFIPELLLKAAGLNVIYMAVGMSIFLFAFHKARQKGSLINIGE